MKKTWLLLTSLLIPVLWTFPTLPSCGCAPEIYAIGRTLEVYSDTEAPTIEKVRKLAQTRLIGKNFEEIKKQELGVFLDPECRSLSPVQTQCSFWNELGIAHDKGIEVLIESNVDGRIEKVEVTQMRSLFWIRL